MIDSPFDSLFIFYIAITHSAFMQIFTILVFYFASRFYYNPKENWYYSDKDKQ